MMGSGWEVSLNVSEGERVVLCSDAEGGTAEAAGPAPSPPPGRWGEVVMPAAFQPRRRGQGRAAAVLPVLLLPPLFSPHRGPPALPEVRAHGSPTVPQSCGGRMPWCCHSPWGAWVGTASARWLCPDRACCPQPPAARSLPSCPPVESDP